MADAAKTLPPRMSVEEFLDWQRKQDKLYELVDGRPYLPYKMMAGASHNHDRVTVNALGHLFGQFRGSPCRPCTSDIAIRIPKGNIRRPDLLVDCGAPGPRDMTAAEPRLVLEVLSPSTMRIDQFQKLEEYKTVPGLRAIVLVDTARPQVMVYARESDESAWAVTMHTELEETLALPGLDVALTLADLYEGVVFEEGAA